MTTWTALFERAADYDVDTETVRETLAAHRDADDADRQRDAEGSDA